MPGTKQNVDTVDRRLISAVPGAHTSTLVLTADQYPAKTNAICNFKLLLWRKSNPCSSAILYRGDRQLDTDILGQTNVPPLEDGIERLFRNVCN
jgi:hypothetical protein